MPDYTAWLIEINDEAAGPKYFQMSDDDDWTRDHNVALHLSREQDAASIIACYGWTRAKPSEHCWPEPVEREVIAESNGHHWIKFQTLICCRDCGIVRRADDQNNPCKGLVHVSTRNPLLDNPLYPLPPKTFNEPSFPVPTDELEKAALKRPRRPRS